jgi:hypothetical protein
MFTSTVQNKETTLNQLPAHLQNRARRDLIGATLGGLNTGSSPHISIAGNRFTLVDDAGNEKPIQTLFLDVCVIDANASVSKIFFDPRTPYEPGGDNSNPPICWSDNGIGASAQASQPQNTSCQLCPQNAWGSSTSKATGKPTKACNDVKKLAVLVPGMEMVFLLRIPPASLKHLAKYTQTLAGHGVDLPDAITRLEFESQGVLKFTPVGYVDEATAALTDKVVAAKATDLLIGRNDRPWTGQGDQQKLAYAAQGGGQQLPPPPPPTPVAPPPQPFGGGQPPAAPFAPSATAQPSAPMGFATPAAPSTNAFGGGQAAQNPPFAQPGTSSPTGATSKRTRGPNKPKGDAAPAPAGPSPQPFSGGTAAEPDGIPPFLQRNAVPPVPPAPPANNFGMQPNPPAPDAGVQAALDAAFRLPT